MNLQPPLPLNRIGQKFGENADGEYAADGLKGHPGIDFGGTEDWGKPIPAAIVSVVSSILSRDSSNLSAYRAVNTVVDDGPDSYEIQYGHCSTIPEVIQVGKSLSIGDTVAMIGNTGDVYTGNPATLVTPAQKNAGSHAGAHVHFQVRKMKKHLATQPDIPGAHYVNDGTGRLTLNGYVYYVPDWNNGYNGCVDPMQFFGVPAAPAIVVDTTIPDDIKAEVVVMNNTKDPSVLAAFGALIAAQFRAWFGW